jgi:hypothetical protein
MVLLAYIDETYRRGEEFWISALVCPGDSIHAISTGLDAVVADAVKKFGVPEDAELHGYELADGSGHWAVMKQMMRARISVYEDTIDVIRSAPDLAWFRAALIERRVNWGDDNDPHDWALKFLLELINSRAAARDEYALCICDDVQNRDVYRKKLQHYRTYGTGGTQSTKLGRIADTLHFAPSCHSRMVQAVDMATYVLNKRRFPPANEKSRAVYEKFWDALEPIRDRGGQRFWPL